MKGIKLNRIEVDILSAKEMNVVKGGASCACSCYYAESGGSSIDANGDAKAALGGGTSTEGRYRLIIREDGRRSYFP